jgi:tetratricopeptide (TPR) repeat protein
VSSTWALSVLLFLPYASLLASSDNIEAQLKDLVRLHPDNFQANYEAGEFYFHAGRLAEGIPYMEKACRLEPSNYVAGYDLALAYFEVRDYSQARRQLETMLRRRNAAELHSLLADVDEAAGDYVAAGSEYQQAARLDPSEEHIFDWGSELLTHRAAEAAAAVFERGTELFPRSPRLLVGLGIALYLRGNYDDSVKKLCSATDLNPSLAWPYLFLARIYHISSATAAEARQRLSRFAEIQPNNPQALYYYAMSLWERDENAHPDSPKIESLLKRSVGLDPNYADARLQLGILFADQRRYQDAIQQFQRAIQVQPNLTTAHYHLAQCYLRTGNQARAKSELQVFQRLKQQDQAETEKQNNEIKQLIVTMKQQGTEAGQK